MSNKDFVISVRDLINKPGQMREYDLDVTVGEPFTNSVVTVPNGANMELELRLESVHEGILATGEAFASATAECSRCLDPLTLAVEVDFQELFAYSVTDEEELAVIDESIDLEQVVRDEVVLSLPFQPVCNESCLGLCAECGVKLAENPQHRHEAAVDPRWSALEKLKDN